MKKKLPEIFANQINKNIGNNKNVFYSNQENIREDTNRNNEYNSKIKKNINQKINDIFSSPKYIYKADVEITLKNGTINKRIVGKNGAHLITYDNELIPITDIIDINMK